MDAPAAADFLGSRFVSGTFVALVAELRAGEGRARRTARRAALEAALVDLSRIFYYAAGAAPEAPLRDELSFAEGYLRLQSLRFGGRLEYRVSADPGLLSLPVRRLSSFPRLERAAAEALELSAGPAFIAVEAVAGPGGSAALSVRAGRSEPRPNPGAGPRIAVIES
jgi:hypothetical protein